MDEIRQNNVSDSISIRNESIWDDFNGHLQISKNIIFKEFFFWENKKKIKKHWVNYLYNKRRMP